MKNEPTCSQAELKAEIEKLRKDKNAVIMAHYYTRPEVQEIADRVAPLFKKLVTESVKRF